MFTYLGWVNQNIAIIFITCIFTHVNNTLFGGGAATIGSIPTHYTTYTVDLDKRYAPFFIW